MAHTFVKEVMTKDVILIDSVKSVKDAAVLMDSNDVGSVVVTRDDIPVGILTERDFVKRVAAVEKSFATPISEVMSKPLIVIGPDDTVWDAAELMHGRSIHKLPVEDENKIVGMITTSDLVKICSMGSDSNMRNIVDQIMLRMKNN